MAGRTPGPWFGPIFTVICAAVAVTTLAYAPGHYASTLAARAADPCPAGTPVVDDDDPACLVTVAGRLTDSRSRSGRAAGTEWLFTPDPPRSAATSLLPAVWLDVPDDNDPEEWTGAQQHLFAGRPVQALYWGDEPVAFATPTGRVTASGFDAGRETLLFWVGLAAACLACMLPVASWAGRRHREPRSGAARLRTTAIGLLPIGALFGSVAALVPSTVPSQVAVAAGVTVGATALLVASSYRSASRSSVARSSAAWRSSGLS